MQNIRAAVLAPFGVISLVFVAQAQVSNKTQAEDSYRPPRTSWGDFDNPSVPFGQVGGGQSPPQRWITMRLVA
jgi:hypothetical protein